MKKKGLSLTTQALVAITVLLVAGITLMGVVLVNQSRASMQTLIYARMLDIANTAADMLDGDSLEKLTAQDAGTEPYEAALSALKVFQDNIELEYIYGVRKVGNKKFEFTVDPTVVDPGEFGQPIKYTEALERASQGTPAVDEVPYEDAWGRFYSAYSPVFNTNGGVAGIVAVDFNANWVDNQIRKQTVSIVIIGILALVVGAAVMLLLTSRIRQQFRALNSEMRSLSADVEALSGEIQIPLSHGYPARARPSGSDEIGELGEKIRTTQRELRAYIDYVHNQAFTDSMTGVGNKTAYTDMLKRLTAKISTNMADFFVIVFDVNGLKAINDNLGHEFGDQMLCDAASVIQKVFGMDHTYRIGGDEFIALLEQVTQAQVDGLLEQLDGEIERFNRGERSYDAPLAISKGAAAYVRGQDRYYKEVFKRADEAMYRDKAAYYARTGKARKNWEA